MAALTSWEMGIKYAFFIFNFVLWLAGTGVMIVGLWLRFDSRTAGLFEGEDLPTVFFTGVYIMIAAGALMMSLGFLGCWGTFKESPCMLGLFFIFLLIIFVMEVAAGTWGLSNNDQSYPTAVAEVFNVSMHIVRGVGIGVAIVMIFGMIFSMMLCCAIKRSRDFV